jgi:hypothetical protein
MIQIAITAAAFEAIADTLPLGIVGYEVEANAKGDRDHIAVVALGNLVDSQP